MAYSFVVTSDGSFLLTADGSYIVVADSGGAAGCLVPLPGAAQIRTPPPPNPVQPLQFTPGGLLAIPITILEQVGDRIPVPPADAATAYDPIDRLSVVETVLAGMVYDTALTWGCQALQATHDVVVALRAAYTEQPGYLEWEFPDPPVGDATTCVRTSDGRRVWANVVAYPDGSFYWILGGLGGYGLEPYWVFGGLADPALYVYP